MQRIYQKFHSELQECFLLIAETQKPDFSLQKKRHKALIVELSFLKVYFAWEQFLEESFMICITGNRADTHSYIHPKNPTHAKQILIGNKQFSRWTHNDVISRGNLLLKRNPYRKTLQPIQQYLDDIYLIRNCIAHGTKDMRDKFETLVRSKLGTFPRGTTPGVFLTLIMPDTTMAFFTYYTDFIAIASRKIAASLR